MILGSAEAAMKKKKKYNLPPPNSLKTEQNWNLNLCEQNR